MDQDYAKKLWEMGKDFRDAIILMTLKKNSMSAYKLAKYFTGKGSNNTVMRNGPLKRLEEKGHITWKKDGREKKYKLTDSGMTLMNEYEETLTKFMEYIDILS